MTTENFQQPVVKLLEYWHLIIRHKWQMLVATFACMFVLALTVWKLPSEYEATTTILVDPQQVPERYVTPAVNSDPSERLNTITQEVLSRTRLQDIMSRFKLYSEISGKVSQEELIERMRDNIRIQVRQGSGPQLSTFTITFQGKKPKIVAAVANELAASFIRWSITSREQKVEVTQSFVAEELQEAKRNLEVQEDKLKVFKMSHLGETPDQTASNLGAISSLRSALQTTVDAANRLEQEKLLLTRLPQTAAPTANPDLSLTRRGRLEIEKRQTETELQHLRETYSERYPDIVNLKRRLEEITGELSSLPLDTADAPDGATTEASATTVRLELIDKDLNRLKEEENRIHAQIASYQAKIDAAPLREQQLIELNRNYDVSKQHYQTLLDKSFNIGMAASLEQKQKAERFTVLDPARVPEKPIKPKRKLMLALAMLCSLALPCLCVIGKEILSASINTEADLKSLVPPGVRIVGLIPRIETSANRSREIQVGITAMLLSLLLSASTAWVVWQMRPLL